MNRNLIILAVTWLCIGHTALAQDGPRNSIGFGGVYAVIGYYTFAEYERFVSDHNSIIARIGFLGYSYDDDEYSEDGSGFGIGAAFRWYFGSQPMGGFFIGVGLELTSTKWDYVDFYTGIGDGTSFAIAPTGQIGGRFNLGSSFYLAPSLITGYFIAVSSDSDTEIESELGFFGGPALTLGFRF